MNTHPLLASAYAAFNERQLDDVLALMTPDVDWPNGMEGGTVRGHAGVRDYWTRQWKAIDPRVTPLHFADEPDGRVRVVVRQVVRSLTGETLHDGTVEHVYRFDGGRIAGMTIESPRPGPDRAL